jgi:hypothetical protein
MGEFGDLGPIDIQIDDPVNHDDKNISPLDEFKSLEYMRDMAFEWLTYYGAVAQEELGMTVRQALEQGVPLITGLMTPLLSQIDPLEVGSYRRALAIAEEYGKRMLALVGQRNNELVHELVWEYPAHSFCIDYEEADRLGLPVEKLNEEHDHKFCEAIMQLERGYYHGFASSQSVTKRPSTTAATVLPEGAVHVGTTDDDNRRSDGVRKAKGPAPSPNVVQNEGGAASAA